MPLRLARGVVAGISIVMLAAPAGAQQASVTDALSQWVALVAPPGAEELATPALRRALPEWQIDRRGNFIKRVGTGRPRRVVACGLDLTAYVVSAITDDGYLRVHRAGTALQHPLADQFLEAQRIRVATAAGAVPGVVAIANGHFTRQHRADTTVVTVDQLWVDVGASSKQEVAALGIQLLDPLYADRAPWQYEGFVSGPGAGSRAGCAAVATAAQGTPVSGETIFVLSVQRTFNWVGLTSALQQLGDVDSITVVDASRPRRDLPKAVTIVPATRFTGSLVESVHADEARALLSRVGAAAGIANVASLSWVAPLAPAVVARTPRRDAYDGLERELMTLLDLPAVPGHEWRVRDAIRAALPAWARTLATVDAAGNLIVAAGPERDSLAFIAHMDEVAYEVETIFADGSVSLTRQGGVIPSAWEGQPALLSFDADASGRVADALRGVFVPRDSARSKQPPALRAWFGLDSAQLVARGVRPGAAITGLKRAMRLAGTRITGRASDDRTGSTALLTAIRRINPKTLNRKVLFVWSTDEESGLLGARAFAERHGAALTRVYAIDTFVSSDTPLEKPTFAFAPLGRGAVLRGLDDGSVSSRAERNRVLQVAQAARIPLQVGTTHGATDGSAIAPYGAAATGLSWPGRYSHTPGEVLDLRDVDALARLIAALAVAP